MDTTINPQVLIECGYLATWNPNTDEMRRFKEVFPELIEVQGQELAEQERHVVKFQAFAEQATHHRAGYDISKDLERLASVPGIRIMKDRTFIVEGKLDCSKIGEAELQSAARVLMDIALGGPVTDLLRGPALMLTRLDELCSQLSELYVQRLEKELQALCERQRPLFRAAQLNPFMPEHTRRYSIKSVPEQIATYFDDLQQSSTQARVDQHSESVEELLKHKLGEWQALGSDPIALRDRVSVGVHDLQDLTRTMGSTYVRESLACVQRFREQHTAVLQGLRIEGMSLDSYVQLHYEGYLKGEIAGHELMEFAWERRCVDVMRYAGEPTKDTWWDADRRNSPIHHLMEDRQRLEAEEKRLRPRRTQSDYEAYDLTRLALVDNKSQLQKFWMDAQERSKNELISSDTFYLQIVRLYARFVRDQVRAEFAQNFLKALAKDSPEQVKELVQGEASYHEGRRDKAAERIAKWYELCAQDKAVHSIHYRLSALEEIGRTVKPKGQDWKHCPQDVMKRADVWSLNRARDSAKATLKKLARRYEGNPAVKAANGEYMRRTRPSGTEATTLRYGPRHEERIKTYGGAWQIES